MNQYPPCCSYIITRQTITVECLTHTQCMSVTIRESVGVADIFTHALQRQLDETMIIHSWYVYDQC